MSPNFKRTALSITLLLLSNAAFAQTETPSPESETEASAPASAPATAVAPTAAPVIAQPSISTSEAKKLEDKIAPEVKRNCDRHYSGQIQGEIRSACTSAAQPYARHGKALAQTRCRLDYGDEPRLVMACLIGTLISDDLAAKKDDFKKKLQLCAEHYPQHTEIDAFLQESCLTGIYAPSLMTVTANERDEACLRITPERSFIGPCAVGLSLGQDLASSGSAPSQQNKLCEQYFDHRKFHMGYRACLNARGVALLGTEKLDDVMKGCTKLVSGSSDVEQAACVVGLNIHRHINQRDDISKTFQKCGDNKVSYQDRDYLACLTAASLLSFTTRNGAEAGCKDLFKTAKNRSRGDCLNSLALF